jgi:hypothetical protein
VLIHPGYFTTDDGLTIKDVETRFGCIGVIEHERVPDGRMFITREVR